VRVHLFVPMLQIYYLLMDGFSEHALCEMLLGGSRSYHILIQMKQYAGLLPI
jgi:hypothetical protein